MTKVKNLCGKLPFDLPTFDFQPSPFDKKLPLQRIFDIII